MFVPPMNESPGTLSYARDQGIKEVFVAPYLVRLISADQPMVPSQRYSIAEVERVTLGRGDRFSHQRSHHDDLSTLSLTAPDGWMSTLHAELHKEGDNWILADVGSKNGTYLNAKQVTKHVLDDGDLIHTGNTTYLFRDAVERGHLEPADVSAAGLSGCAATLSPPLARSMVDLARVATATVSVIVSGETGTGKEVTARYLHERSKRQGAFVAVNCGALPALLVESELFGHRKGAFSGAHSDRVGLVQASDGGTLFLDEIAELPQEAQVTLLRVLQEREVVPVGATRPIPLDLRVVAATHANLQKRVEEGRFRADLYSRLAGVEFSMPSLRERPEDLGLLIATLLKRCAGERSICFEREALWAIALYQWPRNIRELEQALVAAVAWAQDGDIKPAHLPPDVAATLEPKSAPEQDPLREALVQALTAHKGNVSACARTMGKARVQIRRWCKRFSLDPSDFK